MKVCRICKEEKPYSKFYKRPQMTDGYFNECKVCKQEIQSNREKQKRKDPEYIEYYRARKRRLYYINEYNKVERDPEKARESQARHYAKYPEKREARNVVLNTKRTMEGSHFHHWSYNEEHFKDVIELSKADHHTAHRFLEYDKDAKMYRDLYGTLLSTREEHIEYLENILQTELI